jgi:hypothetical protein
VIPEPVDTELFNAARHRALDVMAKDSRFKFLSVFKWETRKGWDILLRSFLAEFSALDGKAGVPLVTSEG